MCELTAVFEGMLSLKSQITVYSQSKQTMSVGADDSQQVEQLTYNCPDLLVKVEKSFSWDYLFIYYFLKTHQTLTGGPVNFVVNADT